MRPIYLSPTVPRGQSATNKSFWKCCRLRRSQRWQYRTINTLTILDPIHLFRFYCPLIATTNSKRLETRGLSRSILWFTRRNVHCPSQKLLDCQSSNVMKLLFRQRKCRCVESSSAVWVIIVAAFIFLDNASASLAFQLVSQRTVSKSNTKLVGQSSSNSKRTQQPQHDYARRTNSLPHLGQHRNARGVSGATTATTTTTTLFSQKDPKNEIGNEKTDASLSKTRKEHVGDDSDDDATDNDKRDLVSLEDMDWETSRIEQEQARKVWFSLMAPDMIGRYVTIALWIFVAFGYLLNFLGYAYILKDGQLSIDTWESRQFQDELVRGVREAARNTNPN